MKKKNSRKMKIFRLQRMDYLSPHPCRGVLSGSSGRSIVGNGGLRSTNGASEAGGLVASASGLFYFSSPELLKQRMTWSGGFW